MRLRKFNLKSSVGVLSGVGAVCGLTVLVKDIFGGEQYNGDEKIHGRTVIVTGANRGMGKEISKELAKRGGRIIMACRDLDKCELARKEIMELTHNLKVVCKRVDMASLKSIRQFAQDINETERRLDILINNAGVMGLQKRQITEDGFERMLCVNFLGPFLLSNLLFEKMQKSSSPILPSRIVNITSAAHRKAKMNFNDLNYDETYYSEADVYNQSKLAVILFTKEMAKRAKGSDVNTYAVNPGVVFTDIGENTKLGKSYIAKYFFAPFWWVVTKKPVQGIQTALYCAVEPDLEETSGKYYAECREDEPSKHAKKEEDAKRLWMIAEKWTHLHVS